MNPHDFNPQSPDAMFARILERMDQLDLALQESRSDVNERLDFLVSESKGLGERVGSLEHDKWYQRGVVAAVAVFATAGWEALKTFLFGK
jgi:hypothetical protein